MSMRRMAGQVLAAGGLGSIGALGADALAHDEMDRTAQDYKGFIGGMRGADELTQRAYAGVFAQGQMSLKDRIMAMGILSGELPPGAADEAKKTADTPAGKKGIDLAGQIMMNRPELGPPIAELADREIRLFVREQKAGVTPSDVMTAAEQGAGVSPIPAVLGGAALGAAGAGIPALIARMRGGG